MSAGVLAAVLLTRALQGLLYETSTTDPATYAAVCALVLAATLGASWIPARRAARADPMTAIKLE